MINKRKLVRLVVEEYWEEICPLCGNLEQPVTKYSDEGFKLMVELKCSKCNLTVSFKKQNTNPKFRPSKKSMKSLDLKPPTFSIQFFR